MACDIQLKHQDILELSREGQEVTYEVSGNSLKLFSGTGFAGGGLAETSKTGIAFQG